MLARFAALTIAACALGWWIVDRTGWHSPGPATLQSHSPERRFAEVSVTAGELLQAARVRLGVPGISAAVNIDGQLVWAAAAGWADAATPKPLSTDSVFGSHRHSRPARSTNKDTGWAGASSATARRWVRPSARRVCIMAESPRAP